VFGWFWLGFRLGAGAGQDHTIGWYAWLRSRGHQEGKVGVGVVVVLGAVAGQAVVIPRSFSHGKWESCCLDSGGWGLPGCWLQHCCWHC
jgi:hypothetical protein